MLTAGGRGWMLEGEMPTLTYSDGVLCVWGEGGRGGGEGGRGGGGRREGGRGGGGGGGRRGGRGGEGGEGGRGVCTHYVELQVSSFCHERSPGFDEKDSDTPLLQTSVEKRTPSSPNNASTACT